MNSKPLRILHLEDSGDDAGLIQIALTNSGLTCDVRVTSTRDQYLAALDRGQFDLILSDGSIPGFDGLSALDVAQKRYPGTPFIFVSGYPIELSPEKLQAKGRVECVQKSEMEKLAPAIKRVLQAAATKVQQNPLYITGHASELLINVVQELSLARDLAAIMAIVRHAARQLTGADGATFVLREREQCYYAEEDAIAPLWKGKRFPMSACISGWAMLHKQPAVIEDIYADSRIPADAYRPTFVKSLVMVPIRTTNPVGAIGNYWATPHRATPEQVKLLQALANSTAIAMENVQFYNKLEQRVEQRALQLEAANKELETFCYSVSHDLRTPLRHLASFSVQLMENASNKLDETGRDYLQRIRHTITRMDQLIDDLLELSRIGQTDVNKQSVDLTCMAKEIASELQGAAPQRKAEFIIEEGISANGDPHLLRVVLENLLSNAWKYTSKKHQASIKLGCRQEAQTQYIYYVQDNGVGFDMDQADKLFEPFQRLHTNSEFPGTGVGLATVARIIQKHGGRIWVESAVEEQGSNFSFTLP